MDRLQDLGLPSLVLDLLKQQAQKSELQLDFNISKWGQTIKLNLTWKPMVKNSQHSAPTVGSGIMKGYHKKTPSELKRDKKRMEYYRNMKREHTCTLHKSSQLKIVQVAN